jgi:two-component system, OmpR family, phosphate regulon sensor histidine kinase PhoR
MADDGTGLAQSLIEAVDDPILVLDRTSTVVLFNQAARRLWPSLSTGSPLTFTVRAPDVLRAVEQVLAGDGRVSGTWTERVPVERLYAFTASPLVGTAGRIDPAVAVGFRDLTEARRLDMMRVDFVANASHELRTPLASVLGFIETLEGPARNDLAVRDRFLAIMKGQAQRMARLIEDLLSLSRIEMKEHRRPETPERLGQIARQITETMRPLALERGVVLSCESPEPDLVVAGDRDELLRLAENLVENAIKYGHAGGRVDVTVDRDDGEPGGPHARLSVRDYGPGIAAVHLPRLTERFYRVDTGDSRDKGGTGLGLALVKHIVNRHRGRLVIESRPGEGACFRVTLPMLPS